MIPGQRVRQSRGTGGRFGKRGPCVLVERVDELWDEKSAGYQAWHVSVDGVVERLVRCIDPDEAKEGNDDVD